MTARQIRCGLIRLPEEWASAIINGDFSGLEYSSSDEEIAQVEREIRELAERGVSVVGTLEESADWRSGSILFLTHETVECEPAEWAVRCLCAYVDRMAWPKGLGPDDFYIASISDLPAIVR